MVVVVETSTSTKRTQKEADRRWKGTRGSRDAKWTVFTAAHVFERGWSDVNGYMNRHCE